MTVLDVGASEATRAAVDTSSVLGSFAAGLEPVDLREMEELALLLARLDRKYVVPVEVARAVMADLAVRPVVLEIDGRRCSRYRSRYFDTPAADSYRGAAFGRRRRFKVRTRTYEDSGVGVLEVKTCGPRGTTVKARVPHDPADQDRLALADAAFVEARTGRPGLAAALGPAVVTAYRRSTFADPTDRSRCTVDEDLTLVGPSGSAAVLHDHVVVETKSTGAATAVDRQLWARGIRPVRISKFGVGTALHDPTLPANRWTPVLRRYFGWAPAPRTPGPG